ncbi:MAG: M48 family metalloprotease [Sphingomonas sp.]|uniref:M48 family metallopeptidase n=1 Tax=Sphingomonas sp. TaxID=28214 RepID=UPI0025E3483F|nr:M48 family metallopeptidase [Sphingomonas sp.]MBY0284015.1 M48 family metalloprotease [Sphingomonas sp.]
MTRRLGALLGLVAMAIQSVAVPAVAQSVAESPTAELRGKPITAIGPGYQPQDRDERGLWLIAEENERELKRSSFVVRDPAINAYVRGVLCRLVGDVECADIRIYVLRVADFNASMSANGVMIINTGLLMRLQDEAELAAVIGHEYAHYRYRHLLLGFREARGKATLAVWLGMTIGVIGTLAALGGYFEYTRDMEAQADAESVPLLTRAGYDPARAAQIWQQIRDEADATAAARKTKSRKDKDRSIWATHPPTADRLAALTRLAAPHRGTGETAGDRYRTVFTNFWPMLIDDEIKRNDFGSTEFLLGNLAQGNWSANLLYARGELYRTRGRTEDMGAAIGFYQQAVATGAAPAEAYRGIGLAELRRGQTAEGKAALRQYLALRPDASDRQMLAAMADEIMGGQ